MLYYVGVCALNHGCLDDPGWHATFSRLGEPWHSLRTGTQDLRLLKVQSIVPDCQLGQDLLPQLGIPRLHKRLDQSDAWVCRASLKHTGSDKLWSVFRYKLTYVSTIFETTLY